MKGTGEFYVVCTAQGQYFYPFTNEGCDAAVKHSNNFQTLTFVIDTSKGEKVETPPSCM